MSYSIGQVAKLMNISSFTLRYYDNSGLFPFIKRDESGKRIFEESDLEFLGVIYCLKQTGMTIPQIKNFIEMTQKGSDSFKDRYNMFVSRREAIDEQIQELLTYRECIDFKCDYYSKAIKANSEEKLIENQDKFPLYKIIELNQKEDKKMKTIVLGGTGHIGSYLIPMLVNEGHDVISITRSESKPYIDSSAWNSVTRILMDRESDPDFEKKLYDMNPDIIVDLINFKFDDTKKIVETFKNSSLSHYIFCSSVWAHGKAEILPFNPDDLDKKPLDKYGKNKFQSELFLKKQFNETNFPATIIMPGQISGPGWNIISPLGNANPEIFQNIADGEVTYLPNFGMETIHHVHAEDVAQVFLNAIIYRDNSLGESFHAVSGSSVTLYGYAKMVYEYFGKECSIKYLPWEDWKKRIDNEEDSLSTYYHISRSGYFDIKKEEKLLKYKPKHTNIDTIKIAIKSYIERGIITLK